MTPLTFILSAFALSVGAGVFGAVLGLGGGIIVVPALSLLLHVDIRYAIGASIVSVIATSSGAGAAYVKDHLTNIRVSMLLETATTTGAVVGAFLATMVAGQWLYVAFGLILLYAAAVMRRAPQRRPVHELPPSRWADRLKLADSYFDEAAGQEVHYRASRTPWALLASTLAGTVSGMLGVGGGVIHVPVMNRVMGLPLKVASATSNFMIGVTAAASAGVYFYRGDINPFIAAPVAMGVVAGSLLGTRILKRIPRATLRKVFILVLVLIAVRMLLKGLNVLP